jgi:hypothetical protein
MQQIPRGESAIINHNQKARSHSKGHRPKARVSKKSTATQRARNEAMAARSLKKKLDLRKAVLTSMGNAIKQLHCTQHEKNSCLFTESALLMRWTGRQNAHMSSTLVLRKENVLPMKMIS